MNKNTFWVDGDAYTIVVPSKAAIEAMIREYQVKPTKGRSVWTSSSMCSGYMLTWSMAGFNQERPTFTRRFVGFRPIVLPAGKHIGETMDYLRDIEDGSIIYLGGIAADGVIVNHDTVLTDVKDLSFVNTPVMEALRIPFRKMHYWLFAEVPICLGLSYDALKKFGFAGD